MNPFQMSADWFLNSAISKIMRHSQNPVATNMQGIHQLSVGARLCAQRQPQHIGRSNPLRLVFDTPALRDTTHFHRQLMDAPADMSPLHFPESFSELTSAATLLKNLS